MAYKQTEPIYSVLAEWYTIYDESKRPVVV